MSSLPSLLKSPTVTALPTLEKLVGGEKATVEKAVRIGRYTTFDVPPPGKGFVTVIETVPAFLIFAAEIFAFDRLADSTLVRIGDPFQLITAVDAKPVPFTVNTNSLPPGWMLTGSRSDLQTEQDWIAPASCSGRRSPIRSRMQRTSLQSSSRRRQRNLYRLSEKHPIVRH